MLCVSRQNSSKNCFEIIFCLMEPGQLCLIFLPSLTPRKTREEWNESCISVAAGGLRSTRLCYFRMSWWKVSSIYITHPYFGWDLIPQALAVHNFFWCIFTKVRYNDPSNWKQDTNLHTSDNPPETAKIISSRYCHKTCDASIIPTQTDITQGGIACLSAGLPPKILTPTTYCLQFPLSLCFSDIPMRLHNLSDWANEAN